MTDVIRVLIAEDSMLQAALIKTIFAQEPDIEVVGHAKNGREAIELAALLKPDLITMDIEMPEVDGLEATRQVMRHTPTPIIILSSHVENEALKVPFHALDYGALSVMQKPGDMNDPDFSSIQEELIETVRAMSEVRVVTHRHKSKQHSVPWEAVPPEKNTNYKMVALGCSTGGPIALRNILSKLPADFPVPIVVIQHMFEEFVLALITWLSRQTELKLKLISEGEALQPGCVYFCPHDLHLLIEKKGAHFVGHLSRAKKYFNFRPSITMLFTSLAQACGGDVIAGILTGLGDDGADGLKALHQKGAFTFVQSPETCVVRSMPDSALNMKAASHVIPIDEVADQLLTLVKK